MPDPTERLNAALEGRYSIERVVTMNWTAVGALAEALGAAGVILSLLYLASQDRLA